MSDPPSFPGVIRVIALLDDEPLEDAWLAVDVEMAHKNHYALLFGPTDACGELVIRAEDLKRQVEQQLALWPMDHVCPQAAWTGSIKVRVQNRTDIANLQIAYDIWKHAGIYPPEFRSRVSRFEAVLDQGENRRLSARVEVTNGEEVDVEVVEQLA